MITDKTKHEHSKVGKCAEKRRTCRNVYVPSCSRRQAFPAPGGEDTTWSFIAKGLLKNDERMKMT